MPGYKRSGGDAPAGGRGQSTGTRPPRTAARDGEREAGRREPPRRESGRREPPPSRYDEDADYELPEPPSRPPAGGGARRGASAARREPEEPARRRGRAGRSRRDEEPSAPTRLADLCAEFFSLVMHLRHSGEIPEPNALERRIAALFEQMADRAADARVPASEVEHARYALAAFIDEVILTAPSASPSKDAWVAMPLQMRYFNENTAGEGFFTRLDEVRHLRGAREALEVYYLCLALGFEGRYRLSSGGELAALIDELRQELAPRRRGAPPLAPNGARPDAAAAPARKELPLYAIAGGFAALVILIVILVAHSVGSSAREGGAHLRELAGSQDQR